MNRFVAGILLVTATVAWAGAEPVYLKGRVRENGNLLILGADNIEREAVLLTVGEYAALTNAMAYLSGSREYREKIHGAVVKRVADAERKAMVYYYADGFTWAEPMVVREGAMRTKMVLGGENGNNRGEKPKGMSDAQWGATKAKLEASRGRSVTATFAPGGELLEVK